MSRDSEAEIVNVSRRRMLIGTTAAMGAVGVVAALTPFVESWNPSARARADSAPVSQDISALEAGQMIVIEWQKKPIYVVRRTDDMLYNLSINDPILRDPESTESKQPDYAKNEYRSRDPHILVMVAVCTHLGCAPNYRPEIGVPELSTDWVGGFFCACHGSKYDLAGRVFQDVPAPRNMEIPKHKLVGNILTIGEDA
ncbi:ubiquinol-cytochrome c reductase iron-sulfur subunit [Aquirhabdus parva]|uniref:Ubiquinol-cytochrome c reductase iron-sulfur subunit n=1 Tax=Aquirhabdus parva TaxID=2283318 RepID=A0A345P3E9_9GAMM|nr:ubiquinol-cytochrome c reductase iron-sulfur subunit [Aquirhabdus parva]AXI01808.1 ubiquinol-cytochrome c reductase iron-sulfur subunit [Aquirhabdus parva]